ncbi:MAG: hypothetical protein WAS94_02535 [Candidatus Saccharimonadales bacterium]
MAAAKREVIYVDSEDDITSIIDKVKSGSSKVVAVAPSKRLGPLQSAVNLRLLQRASQTVGRKLVIVSNDSSLMRIAGGIGIYVSKDLHTRPEIPKVAGAPDHNSEEEIPSEDLESLKKKIEQEAPTANQENEEIKDEIEDTAEKMVVASAIKEKQARKIERARAKQEQEIKLAEEAERNSKPDKDKSEPDKNAFKKRLILLGLFISIFVVILSWALLQKPSATIVIKSKTNPVQYDQAWVIDPSVDSSANAKTFKSKLDSKEEVVSADFGATGQKDIGTKATGQITIVNCNDSSITIASGTAFAAGGKNYISDNSVKIPGSNFFSSGQCKEDGKGNVSVTAVQSGESFNQAATSYQIAGSPGNVSADGTAMTGGTTNLVKIVQQSDIDAAKQKLVVSSDSEYKNKLSVDISDPQKIIDSTFKIDKTEATSSVQAGQQADNGKVEIKINYSIYSINEKEFKSLLVDSMNSEIAPNNQKVYQDPGEIKPEFKQDTQSTSSGALKFSVKTILNTGPNFNEDQLKTELTSKKKGEVISKIEAVSGVSRVDVSISPFWKQKTPGDSSRITIKFSVDE